MRKALFSLAAALMFGLSACGGSGGGGGGSGGGGSSTSSGSGSGSGTSSTCAEVVARCGKSSNCGQMAQGGIDSNQSESWCDQLNQQCATDCSQ